MQHVRFPGPPAREQLRVERALDLLDLHRERGRRDTKHLGRLTEMQLLGDRDEIAKVS